jgi:hypothetical protein
MIWNMNGLSYIICREVAPLLDNTLFERHLSMEIDSLLDP